MLTSTPSGIRNAVTKLKSTHLIKTKMIGSLAYRGWHTAPDSFQLPVQDIQKKLSARKCNGCGTQYSRYWRSDLEEKNGWLCNNCGMNQRRGRGINRVHANDDSSNSDSNMDIAPAAEDNYDEDSELGTLKSVSVISINKE